MTDRKIRSDARRKPPARAEAQCFINGVRGRLKGAWKNVEPGRESRYGRQAAEADLLPYEFGSALEEKVVQEILRRSARNSASGAGWRLGRRILE